MTTADTTRRTFLKHALILAAGAGCARASEGVAVSDAPVAADAPRFDIVVVGAGTGGVPAALAAARMGARVALVEADSLIGGAPVNMGVGFIYGKYRNGIYGEMLDRLNVRGELSGAPLENFNRGIDGRSHWYLPSSYLRVLSAMVGAEKNIALYNNTRIVGVARDEKGNVPRVRGVRLERGGRIFELGAAVVIDATGTGLTAELAGCAMRYGREASSEFGEQFAPEVADDFVQPMTLMYVAQALRDSARIDFKSLPSLRMVKANLGFTAQGKLRKENRHTAAYLCWGPTVQNVDTRDEAQVGAAYAKALAMGEDDFQRLLEAGYTVQLAPKIGLRECRRLVGDATITLADLKSGKFPEDTIALGDYPLDIWGQHVNYKLPTYAIPYRALVPKGVEGLLVAGKNISGTHVAHSAYRVQSIVGPIGEAAGIAAAIAAQTQTSLHSLPLERLQSRLRETHALAATFA